MAQSGNSGQVGGDPGMWRAGSKRREAGSGSTGPWQVDMAEACRLCLNNEGAKAKGAATQSGRHRDGPGGRCSQLKTLSTGLNIKQASSNWIAANNINSLTKWGARQFYRTGWPVPPPAFNTSGHFWSFVTVSPFQNWAQRPRFHSDLSLGLPVNSSNLTWCVC